MKKHLLALLVLSVLSIASAESIKIANFSKKQLTMSEENGVVTMALKKSEGYDTSAGKYIKNHSKNETYEFSCDVDADIRNAVYLQIKLYKNKKELVRKGIPGNRKFKERLRLDFDSRDADTIQLQVRVYNRKMLIGKKIRISNVYFGKPTPKVQEKCQQLETVPGFNAVSIYLNNTSAKRADDFKAAVKYRKQGDSAWKNAIDLVYDESRNQARGSLLGLTENTVYEYEISVNDNGKTELLKGKISTRCSNFPVKKSIILTPENAVEKLSNPECGSKTGYIRYTSKPGTVLDFGIEKNNAIDLTGASYIIFDGLTIKGGLRNAINVEGANDIVIRNCDISGYGKIGQHEPLKDGKYYIKNRALNYDSGVNIQSSDRITVERCFIHDPRGTSNSWFYSHPAGPNAVYIGDSSSVVLRYNDFIGSDKHRWNDAVEGRGNGSLNGSVKADAEIYGNYFAFGNDDGMELDGGQMNCRFAYNKSEGLLCGFSTAPCLIGPSYVFRNLIHRGGDEFDIVGGGVKNNYKTGGRGALFFFNNTVLDHNNGFSSTSFNNIEQKYHKEKYLKVYARNNLIRSNGKPYEKGLFRPDYYYTSVDNDVYEGDKEALNALKADGYASKTIFAKIKFNNEKYGDYTPAQDSKALGAGVFVPGVAEDESVTAGALQKRGDQLPLRFAPFFLDRTVVTLKMTSDESEQAVVTVTPDKNCRGKFRIIQPSGADFFTVTPKEGVFDGKPIQLVVKSAPENIKTARRNTSAFAVKMCDGWSRPVSVEVDSRANAKLLKAARKNIIKGKIECDGETQTLTVDVPKEGYYWLFVKTTGEKAYVQSSLNGAKNQKRMAHTPKYNKNPWCVFSTTVYQGVPNRPVKLSVGKNELKIFSTAFKVTDFAITRNADDFRLAPDDL